MTDRSPPDPLDRLTRALAEAVTSLQAAPPDVHRDRLVGLGRGALQEGGPRARGGLRGDPPSELDELMDAMVLFLARYSEAEARAGLVERLLGAKPN